MTRARGRLLLAGLLAAAAVHAVLARAAPVGSIVDDAVYLLLARALRHGAYVLPDGFARPVTSYWPGAPALWALPAWLFAPRWGLCRGAALAAAWSAVFLVWRLARRLLDADKAAAVTLLAAFNPVFAANAGICGSDVPFLALSCAAFAALPDGKSKRRLGALVLCAAAAALFRPEGLLLIGALALAVFWTEGPRRAGTFAAASLAPALVWLLRNRLLSGSTSDYVRQLASQMPALWDPLAWIDHVLRLVGLLFGRGLFGLRWDPAALAAGIAALAAAGVGAALRLRRGDDARPLALAAYVVAVLVLHALWWQVLERYLLLVLVPVLILAAFAFEGRSARRRVAGAIAGLAALGLGLAADARAVAAAKPAAEPWPETMAYVRAQAPPGAIVQSPVGAVVMLWTDRPAISTFADVSGRDHWLAKCLNNRVEYLVLDEDLSRWRHMPEPWVAVLARLNRWAETSPYVKLQFRSAADATAVYRIAHPDPARYLAAWASFRDAMTSSPDRAAAAAHLKEAVRLEPQLASAWLVLSTLETRPRAAEDDRRRAFAADPALAPPPDAIRPPGSSE